MFAFAKTIRGDGAGAGKRIDTAMKREEIDTPSIELSLCMLQYI